MTPRMYRDRHEAGEILGAHVREHIGARESCVVLALPRGGVPVGFEVARVLEARLDVFVVRKLGVPDHEELAMGAIATGGFEVLNEPLIADLGITNEEIAKVVEREMIELRRREQLYRDDRPALDVSNQTAIVVDDGLATGFTMRAAIAAVRQSGPRRLIAAVPVGAPDTCAEIARAVGTLICPLQPEPFHAVGLWYDDFTATTDDEVHACLIAAADQYNASQLAHRSGEQRRDH